jgi:hypothetical protein
MRGDMRSSSPQFMIADERVPAIDMAEYEEDQWDEDQRYSVSLTMSRSKSAGMCRH